MPGGQLSITIKILKPSNPYATKEAAVVTQSIYQTQFKGIFQKGNMRQEDIGWKVKRPSF